MNGSFFYLAPHSTQSCSSCIANCIRCRFLITQFLLTEALGKSSLPLQIGDSPSAAFLYFASTFINVLALHFKVKFDQLCVQRGLRSRLTSTLQLLN